MNKPIQKKMLYHPALDIPERGMTGRYMPAGVDKNGNFLIEIEFIDSHNALLDKVERMEKK